MNDNRVLIHIPSHGKYVEILGFRIDGFESFDAFCEHLKKYAEMEDTINRQRAEIERLEREIEDLESTQEITPEAKHFIDTKADKVISLMNELIKSQEQIKAEAIKEFLKKAKDLSYESSDWSHGEHPFVVEWEDLMTIYDEMVGEG